MEIVGLDIAKSAGISWVNPAAEPSTWKALAMESEGEDVWSKVIDFHGGLTDLLTARRPDFAVIEHPLDHIKDHGPVAGDYQPGAPVGRMINADTVILLNALAATTISVLLKLEIPFGMIRIATWRATYFEKGFKPPKVWVKDAKKPNGGYEKNDWKAASVARAELLGVQLPATKKASMDAADAVGVAVSWAKCNTIYPHSQAAFMALRQQTGARR